MARPRTISDDDLRRAARDVFVEYGPAVPVALIARRLGVSHAALFGRAGSKDQLMVEALWPEPPAVLAVLAKPPPRRAARARLIEILVSLMQFFDQVIPNLVVLKAAGRSVGDLQTGGGTPPPVALRDALAEWLRCAVDAGAVPRVAPGPVSEGLLGALEARCFNRYLGGDAYAPGADARFVENLVGGLVPARRRAQ